MNNAINLQHLRSEIEKWAESLGFSAIGISTLDIEQEHKHLLTWLENGYHGEMRWMENNLDLRKDPTLLLEQTLRVISVRMNYLPQNASFAKTLSQPDLAYISRYALGRDYHKVLRQRLKQLGEKIKRYCEQAHYRVCVDSAPILERPYAAKAGLGWVGKHSLLLQQDAGSWFFLGELLINLPLPTDSPSQAQCKQCVSCIKSCPTGAIVTPYTVDARRCISYLTIEYDGIIPADIRPLIGNRIYGCDDCQLVCPWNRNAPLTKITDFTPRQWTQNKSLITLFNWSEEEFLTATEGSPIRRIGYQRWLRNIAIALGNGHYHDEIILSLQQRLGLSDILDTHLHWAIEQLKNKKDTSKQIASTKTQRLIRVIEKGLPRDA